MELSRECVASRVSPGNGPLMPPSMGCSMGSLSPTSFAKWGRSSSLRTVETLRDTTSTEAREMLSLARRRDMVFLYGACDANVYNANLHVSYARGEAVLRVLLPLCAAIIQIRSLPAPRVLMLLIVLC